MKALFVVGLFLLTTSFLLAQTNIDDVINLKEVERIEKTFLRMICGEEKYSARTLIRAADFIANEFKKAGLENLQTGTGHTVMILTITARNLPLAQAIRRS